MRLAIFSFVALFNIWLAPALLAAAPPPEPVGDANAGLEFVSKNCTLCHDVSGNGPSPNPKAPIFKKIAVKYPPSNLEEAFAEGIVVGKHGTEMPQFELEPEQIDNIIAYLEKLRKECLPGKK